MTTFTPFLIHTILLLLLLLLSPPFTTALDPASGDVDCSRYDPNASQNKTGKNCLHRLTLFPEEYDECKDPSRNTTCYIFIQEPPFVTLRNAQKWDASDQSIENLQKPFRCGDFADQFLDVGGIAGIAMEIHKRTASADDLCMWGGHSDHCKFNSLVDYTALMAEKDYRFAITGLLLELPIRQCVHEASAPFVDNSMIIIGKKADGTISNGPWHQLTRPFHWSAWAIFGAVLLLFALVCIAIAVRLRAQRKSSYVTAFFIFIGEPDPAMAKDRSFHQGDPSEAMSFATKYGLAMTLYRLALFAFVGIFALFYEVAVVNFLFQQQSISLAKSVTNLSLRELEAYAVLKNSALESVWNATVSTGRPGAWTEDTVPWRQCPTATDCIRKAARGDTSFVVTFEVVGKYLLLQESNCDELTIFETKDILYQFNGGWLYNSKTNTTKRKTIDRELVGLRIDGTMRQLIDEPISDFSCESAVKPDIGPMIVLIPCLVFVMPPLLFSVLVLFLWKRTKPREEVVDKASSDFEAGISTCSTA